MCCYGLLRSIAISRTVLGRGRSALQAGKFTAEEEHLNVNMSSVDREAYLRQGRGVITRERCDLSTVTSPLKVLSMQGELTIFFNELLELTDRHGVDI